MTTSTAVAQRTIDAGGIETATSRPAPVNRS